MAHGDNHAKRILIDDTMANVKKLENGSAADLHTIGRTLSQVAKITCDMYAHNFRTLEGCNDLRKGCAAVVAKKATGKKPIKIKVGPLAFEGFITPALMLALPNIIICVSGLFAIGRWQNWW